MRDSQNKQPLLFLILGSPPPINVQKSGKMNINESIEIHLQSVLDRAEGPFADWPSDKLESMCIFEVMANDFAWNSQRILMASDSLPVGGIRASDVIIPVGDPEIPFPLAGTSVL